MASKARVITGLETLSLAASARTVWGGGSKYMVSKIVIWRKDKSASLPRTWARPTACQRCKACAVVSGLSMARSIVSDAFHISPASKALQAILQSAQQLPQSRHVVPGPRHPWGGLAWKLASSQKCQNGRRSWHVPQNA